MFYLESNDNLRKFYSKSDDGSFLEYFTFSKTYRVLNKRTIIVEESNLLDPRKYDNEIGTLSKALKIMNLDDSSKERGGFQSP